MSSSVGDGFGDQAALAASLGAVAVAPSVAVVIPGVDM